LKQCLATGRRRIGRGVVDHQPLNLPRKEALVIEPLLQKMPLAMAGDDTGDERHSRIGLDTSGPTIVTF
jgi:hypothetical protein